MKNEEKAAPSAYGPAGQDYTLASGRKVRFEQPDLFALASGSGDLPNTIAADIFELIYQGRRETDPVQLLLSNQQHTRKLFHCLQVIMVPRLKLDDDDPDGVVSRREVSASDLAAGYSFLSFGPPFAPNPQPLPSAPPVPPEGATE